MKSTRRLLSLILCLIMCLSLLPVSAFAADDDILTAGWAGSTVQFKLYKSGTLVLEGTGMVDDMAHWSFSPAYSFASDAIAATRSEIKTVVVGEGITEIGQLVFSSCPNLATVSLPKSLQRIQLGAFAVSGLTKITIPAGVYMIGDGAFQGCKNLSSVTLSSTVALFIYDSAFEACTNLKSIVFPETMSGIGSRAFAYSGLNTITFKGNYVSGMIGSDAFEGVTADVYYPVDNNSWNAGLDPMNPANAAAVNFKGHLHWSPAAGQTQTQGWVKKTDGSKDYWYYYVGGKMLVNSWKAYGGEWFYFGADGRMAIGRTKIGNDYYYFGTGGTNDPKLGARFSGFIKDPNDGLDYFYGEDGKWQPSYWGVDDTGLDYYKNGWQKITDSSGNYKWYYIRNQAKVKGWLLSKGYWYYLDPTTGAMVTGWLTVGGKTYYLRPLDKAVADGIPDKEGSMIANCSSTIGSGGDEAVYTFDKNGALIGGKMDENPMGYENGFRKEGPNWVFYRSDGKKATGWLKLDKYWYYFDSNGVMQRGWKQIDGAWYYLTKWAKKGGSWTEITDPTDNSNNPYFAGRMVTGFNTIPYTRNGINSAKDYYFKGSGALNGKGWIKVGLKWYYLEEDGVVATGWFRDGTKWYFLDPTTKPKGEMVTGYVDKLADGSSMKGPDGTVGGQSFKANGEWTGAGDKTGSGKAVSAGAWQKHDGQWYYYNTDGDDYPTNNHALTGWQKLDGKWYYLDPGSSPKGRMLTGWQKIGADWFYFSGSGAMQTGWQKLDGVWYYLNTKHDGAYGKRMTGWQEINGNWYYLDSSTGALQDGWIENPAGSGKWFYLNTDTGSSTYGAMHGGGWMNLNGKKYYFHKEHDGEYGRLEQGKWISDGGKWYYVQASSDPAESWMVTGWQEIGGNWYYFNGEGILQSGWFEWKDKRYFLHDKNDGDYGRMHTDTFGGDVDGWKFNADGSAYKP